MWSAASLSTSKRQKLGTHAEDAFGQTAGDDGVLFYLCVIKVWLRQVVLARTLICRSICRGMMEFMRDILGASISEGGVPDLHQLAAQRLGGINQTQDLSQIRVGLHYEILHCNEPVLCHRIENGCRQGGRHQLHTYLPT